MADPPQKESENQELIDMLIAISVVARHLARKLEEASALQRGSCFPCYSRPDPQAEGAAEPEHGDRKNQNQGEKTHEQDERTGDNPG